MAQKIPTWVWLLGALGVGYFVYTRISSASTLTASAGTSGASASSAGSSSGSGNLLTSGSSNTTFGTGVPLSSGQGVASSAAAGSGENQAINQAYELPGSSAPTAASNSAGALFWDSLLPISSLPSGWVDMPSGAQVPAADLPTATDEVNTFVQWGTDVYALGPQDANGNYPATLVAGG